MIQDVVYDPTTTIALKSINLHHNLIISYMKLNTSKQNIAAGSVLPAGLVVLQKLMFSDRYHVTASALTWVFSSMTGLMLWITTFNRYRASLLLLVLNALRKVRVAYFKVDYTISGAFQYSACSAGAAFTYTFSTIDFWGSILGWSGSIQGCLT